MAQLTPEAYAGGTLTVGSAVVGVRDVSYSKTSGTADHTHTGSPDKEREKHPTWKEASMTFDCVSNGTNFAALEALVGTIASVTWSPAGISAKKFIVTEATITGSLDDDMLTIDVTLEYAGGVASS